MLALLAPPVGGVGGARRPIGHPYGAVGGRAQGGDPLPEFMARGAMTGSS